MNDAILFAEWCFKNKYQYYYNGEYWTWFNRLNVSYYTSEELYEVFKKEV